MEKKLKIVIADDSTELGESCAKAFKAYGMQVSLCPKDGLKVIERVKNEAPDIVLADVFMPNLDILGVLEGIKDIAHLKSKHLRFIADGTIIEDDFIFGAICNSTSVGGVINLDPKLVDLSDGMFELLLIRLPKDLFELNEIVVALSSKKYKTKMISFMSAKNITIETEESINWTLDGEYASGAEEIKVENLNKAIKFITNRKEKI